MANFMANPFAAVSGAHGGLVETEPFARPMSGSADVQVTGAGSLSASFAGAFGSRGRFAGEIVRTGQPALRLVLALDVTDGS